MLWYSLEVPHRGASNEYPQRIFLWRIKKNINTFGLKKASYQELWPGAILIFYFSFIDKKDELAPVPSVGIIVGAIVAVILCMAIAAIMIIILFKR